MTSIDSKSIPYAFKRNFKGSLRLNFYHFYITRLTDFLLHPTINVEHENLRIADIGAGTGIWASELAVKLPSSTIDAMDISAKQFPPEQWRASNVRFTTRDCFQPFPAEYHCQYDIVNIRFWLCVINDDAAIPLLRNLLTLLKPGGYIQWLEGIPSSARVISRNGGAPTPACDKLAEQIKKPAPHSSYDWLEGLSSLFEGENLQVLAQERYDNPDHYQPISGQAQLAGLEEYIYQEGGGSKAVEEFQEQLAEEFSSGSFVDFSYTCLVGRKAL